MLLLYVVNIQAIKLRKEEDTATSITVEIEELQKKKSPSYSIKCAAFLEGTQVMFATIIDEWLEGIRKKKKQKELDTRVKVTPEQRDASDLSKKKESKSIKAGNVWEKSKS
jgi:hypothetical protein